MLVASSIWEYIRPTKWTRFTIIYPLFDAICMEDMLASIKLVKVIIHTLHKLTNTDTALLSFELLRIIFRRNYCLESPKKLALVVANDQISSKQENP